MINKMLQRFGYIGASQVAQTVGQSAANPAAQAASGPVIQTIVKKTGFFTRLGQISALAGLGAAGWAAFQNDAIREKSKAIWMGEISLLEQPDESGISSAQGQHMAQAISSGSSVALQIFGPSTTQEQVARAKLSKPIEEMKQLSLEYKAVVEELKQECGKELIEEQTIENLLEKVQKLRTRISGLRDGAVVMLQSCKDQAKVGDLIRSVKGITDLLNANEADPEMSDLKLRAEMQKAKQSIQLEMETLTGAYDSWKKVRDQEDFPGGPQLTLLKSAIESAESKYKIFDADMKKSQKGELRLRKEIIVQLESLSKNYNEVKDVVVGFEKNRNDANKKQEIKIQAEELFDSLTKQVADVREKEGKWLESFDLETSEIYQTALSNLEGLLEKTNAFLISSEVKECKENTDTRKQLATQAKAFVDEKKSNLAFAETSDRILNRNVVLESQNKDLKKQLEDLIKANQEIKMRLDKSESDLSQMHSERRIALWSGAGIAVGLAALLINR